MKKMFIITLIVAASLSTQIFAQSNLISNKAKRGQLVQKMERALSPEQRAQLSSDIRNSELPESQKQAITSVIESIDDSDLQE